MASRPPRHKAPGARTDQQRKREHDNRRRLTKPWRAWYKLPLWRRRREGQLTAQPLCQRCLEKELIAEATVANHKKPHRGDWELFAYGELESVCKPCHDREIQREERAA
ncbi:MAG: hypothetical protein ACMVO3_22770 [Thalassobaculum sp.]